MWGNVEFAAYYRFDASLFGFQVKFKGTIHGAMVSDSDAGHAKFFTF